MNQIMRSIFLITMIFLLLSTSTPAASQQLTEDEVINKAMILEAVSDADDLIAELEMLVEGYLDDTSDYGVGYSFTNPNPWILHLRGSTISTLSMALPLLPGSVSDPNSLQGRLAARLKSDVMNYLLVEQYWDWEYATTNVPNAAYLQWDNPNLDSISWHHKYYSGPHWDKMYALWAYAFYTGDWNTVLSQCRFVGEQYREGEKTPNPRLGASSTGMPQRSIMLVTGLGIYRDASNDLANGLIGAVRIAERCPTSQWCPLGGCSQSQTKAQARVEARNALNAVLNRLDVPWYRAPVREGWAEVPLVMRGEWSPGYNLTPEVGRWVNARDLAKASNRLDEAASSGALWGLWWTGFVNNGWKDGQAFAEDAWGTPNLSHELFLGRAWMMQESAEELRQVKPWHVVMGRPGEYRDMLYLRSLYALISRHAAVRWVNAY